MIPKIREVNLPTYATLSGATVSLSDMGDRVITAQVKIDYSKDGDIEMIGTDGQPWELEFKGERYIQPITKPQASKENTSRFAIYDLTFQHWAIYQMKRFFFVALANVDSGTPIVDKYIVPLALNLPEFAKALDDILRFYFPDRSIYVYEQDGSYINPDLTDYDTQTKYIEIDHSYIWEVLQKTYELFDCRWSIEKDNEGNYAIKFGYPVTEISHIFSYGYEGGLTRIERQVQDDDIRNQLLGRGGSKNLPYMYFKDYEKFHPNSQDSAYMNYGLPDPDAIPELENILFSELRESNFRSYIQGWKVNEHRIMSTADGWSVTEEGGVFTEEVEGADESFWANRIKVYSYDAERAEEDWAYKKGATDLRFDPVEYVKDDESIEIYGVLQGGLENNEDIFPSIQGMEVELPCVKEGHDGHLVVTLADEVVDVEEVTTDVIKSASDGNPAEVQTEITSPVVVSTGTSTQVGTNPLRVTFAAPGTIVVQTEPFEVAEGYYGNVIYPPTLDAHARYQIQYTPIVGGVQGSSKISAEIDAKEFVSRVLDWAVYNYDTREALTYSTNLPPGKYYIVATYETVGITETIPEQSFENGYIIQRPNFVQPNSVRIRVSATATCYSYNFNGEVIPNADGTSPISETKTIQPNSSALFEMVGSQLSVPASGALMVECPVSVTPKESALTEITLKILDLNSRQFVNNSNLPEGDYELRVDVKVTNSDRDYSHPFTVSLLPAFLYYNSDGDDWKPTFDIWIKNIFNTDRAAYDTDQKYVDGVWLPLRSTEEMAVTFTTGNLSRHSDWEFKVANGGIAYDNSKILTITDDQGVEHEVRSEWRLTLIKSDAEADAIHKYVPYKDFNAAPYDRFLFTGIYLPWAYVYAAEKAENAYKEAALLKSKDILPTWVVATDKVRMEQTGLGDIIKPGDKLWVKDSRFTPDVGVQLYAQSITYTWSDSNNTGMKLPDIEIVLSDKVETALSSVQRIQGDIEVLSTQLKGLSNIERAIRKVGDVIYLRKDGFEDTTYSPTRVARTLSSENYRQGIVGGAGWSTYIDENGDSVVEVDKILARKELNVNSLVVNQITAIGGKEILSAASFEITRVEQTEDGILCFFDQRGGSVANLFEEGDIAMSQMFDAENNQTRFYKKEVLEVSANSVLLSRSVHSAGDAEPAVGDILVQYGSYTTASRQYVIIRDVIGGGYTRMLSGLSSVEANGDEYYFAGVQSGSSPRWFVGNMLGEYAEWANGELTIKGKVTVTGGNLSYLIGSLPEADSSTQIEGGLVLSNIIGVKDENDDIVALINGVSAEGFEDADHGTLMIAAGITDITDPAEYAATRIFGDGTIITSKLIATNAEISGSVSAQSGTIGGFEIASDHIGLARTSSQTGLSMYPDMLRLHGQTGNLVYPGIVNDARIGYEVGPLGGASRMSVMLGLVSTGSAANLTSGYRIGAYIDIPDASEDVRGTAIYCPNGMYSGLRPQIDFLQDENVTLNEFQNIIVSNNASARTITLPSQPKIGQYYEILHMTTVNLTISSAFPIYSLYDGVFLFSQSIPSRGVSRLWFVDRTATISGTTYRGYWLSR